MESGKILDSRLKILEKLGEGGMGIVYSAVDLFENKPVAVKVLKSQKTSQYIEDIIRFKKELEILSRLSHDNIIKLFGTGEYENNCYMVMEKLVGYNLSSLLAENYHFSLSESIDIIKQITMALEYVHSHGILHRDVKPGNVFISQKEDKNNVKLLDFGISHIMELNSITSENEVVGTFGYISPEASGILNNVVDERSDLYSVGIIFYQLVTGQMPFKGKNTRMLLHNQVAYMPIRPMLINPSIPETVDEIIMKLINKDSDLRYQSAKGLVFDLERFEAGEKNFPIGSMDQKVKLTYQTKLIGREPEFGRLKELYERACCGKGAFVLISGEAGVGKTKLVEAFKSYAYSNGGLVIRGRSLNQSNKVPYELFKDATDELVAILETWDKENMAALQEKIKKKLGSLLEILEKLNPRIKKIVGTEKRLQSIEPERENQRFLNAISDFLCNIGNTGEPLVLLLEDLHWSEDGSMLILEEISKKIEVSNILIVGTYRSSEINSEHRINKIRKKFFNGSDYFAEIKLSVLDLFSINKLVKDVLYENEEDSKALAEFIYKKSGGNPLFAIHLLRDMVESKSIVWEENKWHEDWNKVKGFYISDNIIDIILKRAGQLNYKQLKLISTASVIGREFDLEILYFLLDLSKEEAINLVDEIIELNLLERGTEKGRISFTHDRIRDAFYEKISDSEKVKIHHKIAEILEKESKKSDAYIFDLAHHYIEGQDTDKALKYILPAANLACETFAYDTAIHFYNIALSLLEEEGMLGSDEWCSACQNLSEVYIIIGKCQPAIEVLEKVLPLVTDKVLKAGILRKLGIAQYKIDNWDKAEELIYSGLEILGERVPSNQAVFGGSLVKEFLMHFVLLRSAKKNLYKNNLTDKNYIDGGFGNKSLCNEEKIQKAENPNLYKEIISLYKILFHIFIFKRVDLKYFYLFLRNLNISILNPPGIIELGETLSEYSIMLSIIHQNRRSEKYFKLASEVFYSLNDEWKYFWNMRNQGFLYSWMGKRKQSLDYFEEARAFFEKIGDYWELAFIYDGLAENYYYTSEYKKSLEAAYKNLKIKQQVNEIYGICNAKTEIAIVYIDTGDFVKAEALLNEVLKVTRENKIWFINCIALFQYGYLEAERSQYDIAADFLYEAIEINEKNTFLKDYTVQVYSKLAEVLMRKYISDGNVKNISWDRKVKNEIARAVAKSLRFSKSWPNQYGVALGVAALYKGLLGKWNSSERLFEKSLKSLKNTGRKFEEGKALMDFAIILANQNRLVDSRRYFEKAYSIFKSIGANNYSQKCARIIGYNRPDNEEKHTSQKDRLSWDRRMDTVLTTSRHLSSILDIDMLLEKILDCTIELVGAQRGLLFIYSQNESKNLEIKALRNFSENEVKNRQFEISQSILKKIESEKSPVIISDAISDESYKNQYSIIQSSIRSVLCAPVITRGEMIGLIYLDNNLVSGLFTDDDIKVLDIISNQAGVSIENARLYNKLKAYSEEIEMSRNQISLWSKELETRVEERTCQLQKVNDDLAQMNIQLREYAQTVEELSIIKERNRMAKDVHDTVGHSMTSLLTLLEVCKVSCGKDVGKTVEKLDEASDIARTSLEKIRRSISGLLPEELEERDIVSAVESMIESFKHTGIEFNFSVDQPDIKVSQKYSSIIFRACQESITNALRHGNPTEVDIVLKLINDKIKLFIVDNGKGCAEIEEGIGLRSMKQRVESVDGILRYGSDGNQGFHINIEIPLK